MSESTTGKRSALQEIARFLGLTLLLQAMLGLAAHATGHLVAYLASSLGIATVMFVYLLLPTAADYRKRMGAGLSIWHWGIVTFGVATGSCLASALLLCMAVGVYVAGMALLTAYTAISSSPFLAKPFALMLTGGVTIGAGALFFYFRLRQRLLYGVTELVMGAVVSAYNMSLQKEIGFPTNTGFYFAFLTAGVYLCVRGMDNIHQGYRPDDWLVQQLLAWREKVIRSGSPGVDQSVKRVD